MNIRFNGKRALVTGAGKGIGRETAILLHECGAHVIALSRTQADLDTLHAQIGCETIAVDLADADATRAAGERAGDIDLLVNNAAVAILESFLDTTVKAFDETMAVNVRAPMILGQIAARSMIQRGVKGAIVNISSLGSVITSTDHTAYNSSKGALDQLTRIMANELGPHGIRVNSVNPTITLTPMGERAWHDPAKSQPMLDRIPLGRFLQPVEVAHAIVYLLSDYASMISGEILFVDGGFRTK